jgi:hypothetical protein
MIPILSTDDGPVGKQVRYWLKDFADEIRFFIVGCFPGTFQGQEDFTI